MKNLYRFLIDKVDNGVVVIDGKQQIAVWNEWMEKQTKKTADNVYGKSLGEVAEIFQQSKYINIIDAAINNGQKRFCSGALHRAFFMPSDEEWDKTYIRQNMQIQPIVLDGKKYVLLEVHDISEQYSQVRKLKNFILELQNEHNNLQRRENEYRHKAHHDSLTGLPNRYLLSEKIISELDGERQEQLSALFFIDLDNFKSVNDSYGHPVGDRLLIEVAGRLKKSVRHDDLLARLGGDEFVIFFPNVQKVENLIDIAEKLIYEMAVKYVIDDIEMSISCSAGIALYPGDGDSPETLLDNADVALRNAKEAGRNRYLFYNSAMSELIQARKAAENIHIKQEVQIQEIHTRLSDYSEKLKEKLDAIKQDMIGKECKKLANEIGSIANDLERLEIDMRNVCK